MDKERLGRALPSFLQLLYPREIAPITVLFLLAFYAPNWTVIASAATQLAGALLVFRYIYKNTPKSHNILQLSKNMRNAFTEKFDENLEAEDLQDVIGELDQPALTGWQGLADFVISHSPFKWSTLLFLAAFGANIIPLLETSAEPKDVNIIRLPAAFLGLTFGLLELTRVLDRLLNNKRLEAAREWLRQIQQNVFPKSQEDSA